MTGYRGPSKGRQEDAGPAMTPSVTSRQAEILKLRALGYTSEYIGYRLGIQETTVKNITALAYRRLDANCLVDALRAIGWLEVPE